MKNFIFLTILGASLAVCEQNGNTQRSTDAAVAEAPATHLGGCILLEPNRQALDDLHAVGNVVATDEIAPFSKMLLVKGLTLAARDEISDEFFEYGLIPFSLIRWEMTGATDEIEKLW